MASWPLPAVQDQGWLLLALGALVAAAMATASAVAMRRLGCGVRFVVGGMLGAVGAVGLS